MDNNDFDRRCPLCGGMLLEKVCIDCGFESLTEEEIAAPYDFEPSNDYYGDEEDDETEIMEGISIESISAESLDKGMSSVSIKLSSSVSSRSNTAYNQPVKKTAASAMKNNSVDVSKSFKDPTVSDVAQIMVKDFVEILKKHWWKILPTLMFPIVGLLIGFVYCVIGFNKNCDADNLDFDLGMFFKGICYIAAAGMLMKFGIGFVGI